MAVFFKNGQGGGSWGDAPIEIPEGSKSGTLNAAKNAIDKAADIITSPADVIAWIKNNWQLSLLAAVAVFVILRD